jgi:hypothetical protein
MLDIIGGGVFGTIFGGLFRLAPEVLKFLDRKNERQHELAMFNRQCELEQIRGEMKLAEIRAERDLAIDSGVMSAFEAAITQQAQMAKSAGGWVASLSASVRPVVTYWILAIWSLSHIWFAVIAHHEGMAVRDVFKMIMSPDFAALVAGTFNYWFLDRTLKVRGLA